MPDQKKTPKQKNTLRQKQQHVLHAQKDRQKTHKRPASARAHAQLKKLRFALPLLIIVFLIVGTVQWSTNGIFKGNSNTKKQERHLTKKEIAARQARVAKKLKHNLMTGWQEDLTDYSGNAAIAVYSEKTGETYSASNVETDRAFAMASTVKVSILAELLHQRSGTLTSSEETIAANMITYSDNDSATTLVSHIGGTYALNNLFDALGMQASTTASGGWGATQSTAADQVTLLNAIAYGTSDYLDEASRTKMLELMNEVTEEQNWGVSAGSATSYLKNGWLPRSNGWVVNSVGYIPSTSDGAKDSYTIAVYTDANSDMVAGQALIERLALTTKKILQPKAVVEASAESTQTDAQDSKQ